VCGNVIFIFFMSVVSCLPILKLLADGNKLSCERLESLLAQKPGNIIRQVGLLRSLGIPVETVNLEYQIPGGLYIPTLPELRRLVEFPIEMMTAVESTNGLLMKASTTDKCLIALYQREGRGRRGKEWVGAPGRTLMLSIGKSIALPAESLTTLSIAIGISLCKTMRRLNVPAELKWPNDLWVGRFKLAGFLTELRVGAHGFMFAVIGLGLNLDTILGLEADVATVANFTKQPWTDYETIVLINALLQTCDTFSHISAEALINDYAEVSLLDGRQIEVRSNSSILVGVADGIDSSGRLRVITDNGLVTVVAGDVSVRPTT
jgi:BirA family biotin operon repressor/biotin-[acetyl-CoA-carboxylase] ligase